MSQLRRAAAPVLAALRAAASPAESASSSFRAGRTFCSHVEEGAPAVTYVDIAREWYMRQRQLITLGNRLPNIALTGWVAPSAVLVGNVDVGSKVGEWLCLQRRVACRRGLTDAWRSHPGRGGRQAPGHAQACLAAAASVHCCSQRLRASAASAASLQASIWDRVVLRGDLNYVSVGQLSNVQDGCVLHAARCVRIARRGSRPQSCLLRCRAAAVQLQPPRSCGPPTPAPTGLRPPG